MNSPIRISTALALMLGSTAGAQPLLLDFSGGNAATLSFSATSGWNFVVTGGPITINGLGFFDVGADGLSQDHPVGLWNSGGTLLASTTVTTVSPLVSSASTDGDWRMESVSELILAPGEYFVGAFYQASGPDMFMYLMPSGNITTIPGVTYQSFHFASGPTLTFPAAVFGGVTGAFGPTLQVVVPEPGTVGAVVALVTIGGITTWRRHRAAQARAS